MLVGFLLCLAVAVVGALVFVYSGLYDVRADKKPGAVKRWLLSTTMKRSVQTRAEDIDVPDLDTRKMLITGAGHYDEMCADCHGAPGAEPAELAEGLNPQPPRLARSDPDEDPAELFWVTKYGLEMTGMPSWGESHDDESIWAMVAIMKKLPAMSAEEYESLVETAKSDAHHHREGAHRHHDHGHGHGH